MLPTLVLVLAACTADPVDGTLASLDTAGPRRDQDDTPPDRPDGGDDGPDTRTAAERIAAIDRTVDPERVYTHTQTRFVPPEGRTLLFLGQTVERIDELTTTFPDEPRPAGWSAYWGIPEFAGITGPHVGEHGVTQDHQKLVDEFDHSIVHSAMWMVGTWDVARNTANGDYDAVIDQYAAWANATDRPIFLRLGYEFDGPHNELEPDEYKAAYRHIVDRMRAAGVDNVAWLWHSYASAPYQGHDVSAWYPGDDYVDWVAVSVFGHMYSGPDLGPDGQAVLDLAREHGKPVMVAESSAVHGIDPDDPGAWDDWFVPFFSFVYRNDVRAIAFISEDWTTLDFPGVQWEDARLTTNPDVAEAFWLETAGERWLHASPELWGEIGYPAE